MLIVKEYCSEAAEGSSVWGGKVSQLDTHKLDTSSTQCHIIALQYSSLLLWGGGGGVAPPPPPPPPPVPPPLLLTIILRKV